MFDKEYSVDGFNLLNLSTPYKLAQWLILLPKRKENYSFLFHSESMAHLLLTTNLAQDNPSSKMIALPLTSVISLPIHSQSQINNSQNLSEFDLSLHQSVPYYPRPIPMHNISMIQNHRSPELRMADATEEYESSHSELFTDSDFDDNYNFQPSKISNMGLFTMASNDMALQDLKPGELPINNSVDDAPALMTMISSNFPLRASSDLNNVHRSSASSRSSNVLSHINTQNTVHNENKSSTNAEKFKEKQLFIEGNEKKVDDDLDMDNEDLAAGNAHRNYRQMTIEKKNIMEDAVLLSNEKSVNFVVEPMMQEISKISSTNTDIVRLNDEQTMVRKIAFVFCENQWTGDMINNAKEFNKPTFDALLDVGDIPKNNPTVRYVWKVINYSQHKTVDETFNEKQLHIKWFWFDCRQLNNDWKWKKYNVVICQWICKCYQNYLDFYDENVGRNDGKLLEKEYDFFLCEEELQLKKKNEKRRKDKNIENEENGNENEFKDDEKGYESEIGEEKIPVKPITIDHQLSDSIKNGVHHSLVIEWNDEEKHIELWHKKYAPKSEVTKFCEYHEIRNELQLVSVAAHSIDRKVIHTPFEGFSK